MIDILKNICLDIKYFYKHSYHDLQKYTVLFSLFGVSISCKCFYAYLLYQKGAVNSDRFNEFIKAIYKNVKNKLIILDNVQIHKKNQQKNNKR